ncbi:MAG: glycosyltransferase [Bacteroidota bacterium]
MNSPLVTVVCLCYNHSKFVVDAIQSAIDQTYEKLEIIVIDDFSRDNSVRKILEFIENKPQIKFIQNEKNLGNCRSFNKAFEESSGEYFIDLAADDILRPNRVEHDLEVLQKLPEEYGVTYSDAEYIDDRGSFLGFHFSGSNPRIRIEDPPQGDIYTQLVGRYFIPAPTMTIKRKVLEELDGYDEQLSYEDFDFWVRSSRNWKYAYAPAVNTKIRVLESSMSKNLGRKEDRQLLSTYEVCKKISDLSRTKDEKRALKRRLLYQFKEAIRYNKTGVALKFLKMIVSA